MRHVARGECVPTREGETVHGGQLVVGSGIVGDQGSGTAARGHPFL